MLVLWGDLSKRQLCGLLIDAFPTEFLGQRSAGKAALGMPSANQHGCVLGVINQADLNEPIENALGNLLRNVLLRHRLG